MSLTLKVDDISSWGQRKEPERFTPVYTTDNVHWRAVDQYHGVRGERPDMKWGLYLGESKVLIVLDDEAVK